LFLRLVLSGNFGIIGGLVKTGGSMSRLLHRVCVQEEAIAADGVYSRDLAVNPLSVVLVNIRPLNDNAALTSFAQILQICAAFNRISVLLNGASLFSMRGEDAAALAFFRNGFIPFEANGDDADNERRSIVLPLFLGRFAYDSMHCVPESRRGELVLEADIDIADTGYDGFRWSIETIELPGARPRWVERKVSIAQTFAATGPNDVPLPVGSLLRGLLLFGTTSFTGASPAPTWGRVSLLADGAQVGYVASDFETMVSLSMLQGRQPPGIAHTHRVDATAAVATQETQTKPVEYGQDGWQNYAYMDLDPTRDDEFSLDTSRFSTLLVRADAETADAARVIMVERIPVNMFGSGCG
jgi:hypothetical protein